MKRHRRCNLELFFIVLLLVLTSCSRYTFAKGKPNVTTDRYRENIKKAEELLFAKKRTEAVNLLIEALPKDISAKKEATEIKTYLGSINQFFLNEKSQQNYELALNLKKTDPSQALSKLNEALGWESDNYKILGEITKIKIQKKDCQSQLITIEKANELNPWDESLPLILLQLYFCTGDLTKAEKIRERYKDLRNKADYVFWLENEILFNLKKGNIVVTKELMSKLLVLDAKYPQVELLEFLVELVEKSKNSSLKIMATKKKFSCESLSPTVLRKYNNNPYFCEYDTLKELL